MDQKANYLVGNPLPLTRNLTEEEKESTDDEEFTEINDLLAEKFDDDIWDSAKCLNKGVAWLHPFIDEEGNFDYAL